MAERTVVEFGGAADEQQVVAAASGEEAEASRRLAAGTSSQRLQDSDGGGGGGGEEEEQIWAKVSDFEEGGDRRNRWRPRNERSADRFRPSRFSAPTRKQKFPRFVETPPPSH